MKPVSSASKWTVAIVVGLAGAAGVLAWSFGDEAEAREPANHSAVVGKPFQISDSVKKFCETDAQIMMCEQTMPLLAAMRAEPRDPNWAVPMEALIEKFMRVGGKPWVQIRALECRGTYCALEYAVYVNDLDHDVDGDEELERLLDPLTGIVIPEMDSGSGKPMMVSVLVWRKRPSP